MWSFWGWSFVLPGISRRKVKNLKIPGGFQKNMSSTTLFFFFFWNSPIWLERGSSSIFLLSQSYVSQIFTATFSQQTLLVFFQHHPRLSSPQRNGILWILPSLHFQKDHQALQSLCSQGYCTLRDFPGN